MMKSLLLMTFPASTLGRVHPSNLLNSPLNPFAWHCQTRINAERQLVLNERAAKEREIAAKERERAAKEAEKAANQQERAAKNKAIEQSEICIRKVAQVQQDLAAEQSTSAKLRTGLQSEMDLKHQRVQELSTLRDVEITLRGELEALTAVKLELEEKVKVKNQSIAELRYELQEERHMRLLAEEQAHSKERSEASWLLELQAVIGEKKALIQKIHAQHSVEEQLHAELMAKVDRARQIGSFIDNSLGIHAGQPLQQQEDQAEVRDTYAWLKNCAASTRGTQHKVEAALMTFLIIAATACANSWMKVRSGGAVEWEKILAEERSQTLAVMDQAKREMARANFLEQELEEERSSKVGIVTRVPQTDSSSEFAFEIFDEELESERLRWVKIQCAGVTHDEVAVDIIFNGCIVNIVRQGFSGVKPLSWTQHFQFSPADGLFEFRTDRANLEHGVLSLVFSSDKFHARIFRFPPHFSLTSQDEDLVSNYPADAQTNEGCCTSESWQETPGMAAQASDLTLSENSVTDAASEVHEFEHVDTASDMATTEGFQFVSGPTMVLAQR